MIHPDKSRLEVPPEEATPPGAGSPEARLRAAGLVLPPILHPPDLKTALGTESEAAAIRLARRLGIPVVKVGRSQVVLRDELLRCLRQRGSPASLRVLGNSIDKGDTR